MINIGDLLAVLYTLNGYGHFWETRLNAQNKIEWKMIKVGVNPKTKRPIWAHVYGPHLGRHAMLGYLYRNINDTTVEANYKFGINVVVHLLTRYQEKFRFLPIELPEPTSLQKKEKKVKDGEEEEEEEKTDDKKTKPKPRKKTLEDSLSGFGRNLPNVGAPPKPGQKPGENN